MPLAGIALSLLLFTAAASAQTFEVASLHPSGPKSIRGSDGGPGSKDPTRYTFGRMTLLDLIATAYNVESFQISSTLPLDRDEFALSATLPAGTTKDEFRTMLRNLLLDRFHAILHIDIHLFPAFQMTRAKGGTKLGTAAATNLASEKDFPRLPSGKPGIKAVNTISHGHLLTRIRARQQPLSRLAELLRTAEPNPVVDMTELTGTWDFALEFSTDLPNASADAASEPATAPDLTSALREQLGLQLVARKLPFNVVAVDSFERTPTEN